MLRSTNPPTVAPITRRLSPTSFETSDSYQCTEWLRSIGYVDEPPRGTEHARLRIGAGVCVVWSSGLVVCVGGER